MSPWSWTLAKLVSAGTASWLDYKETGRKGLPCLLGSGGWQVEVEAVEDYHQRIGCCRKNIGGVYGRLLLSDEEQLDNPHTLS
jgi:hypothetical protein